MSINDEDDSKKIIEELAAAWKQSSSNLNQYFDALKKEKEKTQLVCPKCGSACRKGSKFCSSCGSKIEFKNICASCGADLKPSAKFCSSCGKKVL